MPGERLLRLMRSITGATRVVAVIGDPARYSLSPTMHNAAFAACDLVPPIEARVDKEPADGGKKANVKHSSANFRLVQMAVSASA